MKKIYFVSSNRHKAKQAKAVFKEFGIGVSWIKRSYDEASDDNMRQISEKAAEKLSSELKKVVFVEDTGIFFDAYNEFPGALAKFTYNSIGYDGIFRLLKGKSTKAKFVSVVGYCEPKKKPKLFTAEMKGRIIFEVRCRSKDVLPYERIFVPNGKKKVLGELKIEEKYTLLHRTKAFRKLAIFLSKN
jgi:XTP/dITP diphosphohydrolase